MAEVAFRIAQRRVDFVQEAVDSLQIDCNEAEFAINVEQLVAEVAELENVISRVIAPLRQGCQPETDPHVLAAAQGVAFLLNRAMAFFPKVRDLVQEARRRNNPVDGIEGFDKSESAIARMREDFFFRWPMPDEARVKTAKEQIAAGQYRVL